MDAVPTSSFKREEAQERKRTRVVIYAFLSKRFRAMSQSSVLPDDLYTRTYMQYFPAHYFTVTALRTYKQQKKSI